MKKFIKMILLITISSILLIGCKTKESEKNIENLINKLISIKTYESFTYADIVNGSVEEGRVDSELEKYQKDSEDAFGKYFTDSGYESLINKKLPFVYYLVINNVDEIKDLEIVQVRKTEYDNYIEYEYEVSYILESDNESLELKDYMVFKVRNEETPLISNIDILEDTSGVFPEFYKAKSNTN